MHDARSISSTVIAFHFLVSHSTGVDCYLLVIHGGTPGVLHHNRTGRISSTRFCGGYRAAG